MSFFDSAVVSTQPQISFSSFTPSLLWSEENQFAPILGWGKQIAFQNGGFS
jgi:chloramphenicol O-acetyltransferase